MYVGTASWIIPKSEILSFPFTGSHLERYSKIFNGVEINTSFYKDHLPKSYEKWAEITPKDFRFSVKLHQRFTHTCEEASGLDLNACLEDIAHLEDKWTALVVQFPAGKKFDVSNMNRIYKIIRKRFDGLIALEPRNLTWATKEALALMYEYNITKVEADPEKCPGIEITNEQYLRLHGSPEIYRSSYTEDYLEDLNQKIFNMPQNSWIIFDNTVFGYATQNALTLIQKEEEAEKNRRTRLYEDYINVENLLGR